MPPPGFSGTVGETTLSVEQLASHRHGAFSFVGSGPGSGLGAENNQAGVYYVSGSSPTGGSLPHSHGLTGASGEASNQPPHYVLAFIMRVG